MLTLGLNTALTEITLVLFTTLAPSGLVTYVICACMVASNHVFGLDRQRLAQGLWLPIIFVLVGLIASATHLGNPSNALYVLAGIGRSPLSNEVAAGILFLVLSGTFWLYCFVRKPRAILMCIWPIVASITGAFFLYSISQAYSAETIITWYTPLVPALLFANSLVGGPLLAVFTIDVSGYYQVKRQITHTFQLNKLFKQICCLVSLIALIVNALFLFVYGSLLRSSANSIASGEELLPLFIVSSVAYIVLAFIGILVVGKVHCDANTNVDVHTLRRIGLALVLVFVGIFFTRFLFYMAHMTVGLAI